MPRTSIATGMVDWILKVAEMPERHMDEFLRKFLPAVETSLSRPATEG